MATQENNGGQRPSPGQGGLPARPPASPRQRSDGRPLPPFVRYEDVTAACGHAVSFGLCEDRLDKYRAARRQKVTGRICPACREQRQQEEQEAAAHRRAGQGRLVTFWRRAARYLSSRSSQRPNCTAWPQAAVTSS